MRTYDWVKEAEAAIREHFASRDAARAITTKKVVARKRFVDVLSNGDTVWSYTYHGETVRMTQRAYDCIVDYA